MDRAAVGKLGEGFAEQFLKKRDYIIVRKNYNTRLGEVDIIAQTGNTLAFVEVRTKTRTDFGLPRETVGYYKKNRIIKASKQYIAENQLDLNFRFDVIEVILNSGKARVEHFENAFFEK